jgi:hypothetical protein
VRLVLIEGEFGIARLGPFEPIPPWARGDAFSSVTRTAEELSVVCAAAAIPANVRAERGWRVLRVAGTLDFSLTGVLSSIAGPLAAAGVSTFAVSTYDTDYVLVREARLAEAVERLRAAGHDVHTP